MTSADEVFRCVYCGAPVDVTPFAVVVVCGYCGGVSVVEGQAALFSVPSENKGGLRNLVESFVRKKAGPMSFVRDVKYLMVPMWVVEVDASTRYNGYRTERRSMVVGSGKNARRSSYTVYVPVKGTFKEKVTVAVFGRKFESLFGLGTVKASVLLRQREAANLEPATIAGWDVLGSELSHVEAVETAKTRVADEHRRRAEKMTSKLFDCYTDVTPVSARLILYPVVEARYESGGKSYRVCVDGAKNTAKVLKAELPITMRARVVRAAATAGLVLALGLAAVFLQPLVGSDLPEEVQFIVVALPPFLAAVAGLGGTVSATAVQRIKKTVEETDFWVLK